MSKLYDLRKKLKQHLVDDLGWAEASIIIKRQTNIWNDIAVAMSTAETGVCCVIGVARGRNPDPDGKLMMELTIPVTLICDINLDEGEPEEEDLWEAMVKSVNGKSLHPTGHCRFEFQFDTFVDDIELADGEANWLARQTIFKVRQNF